MGSRRFQAANGHWFPCKEKKQPCVP